MNAYIKTASILFGCIPATLASILALPVFLIGCIIASSGELLGGIYVLWSLAGLWGTLSLWRVTFISFTRLDFSGLICGILAMAPWALIVLADLFTARQVYDRQPVYLELLEFWLFCGPLLTAFFYLIMSRGKKYRAARLEPAKV